MWAYVNFWLAALAGLTAGYVMLLANSWLQTIVGLTGLDFGQAGLLYAGGDVPGARAIGLVAHLFNSVLLGELYALTVFPVLTGIGTGAGLIAAGVAGGIVFGIVIWLVLAMLFAMPLVGLGIFGRKTGSARPAIVALGLHTVYGLILGFVYLP
jgi:hypothetical protein